MSLPPPDLKPAISRGWEVPLAFAGGFAASVLLSRRGRLVIVAGLAAAAGVRFLLRRPAVTAIQIDPAPQPLEPPVPALEPMPLVDGSATAGRSEPLIWEASSAAESWGASVAETVWFGAVPAMPVPANWESPVLPEEIFHQGPAPAVVVPSEVPVSHPVADTIFASPEITAASPEVQAVVTTAPATVPDVPCQVKTGGLPPPRKAGEAPRVISPPLIGDKENDENLNCDDEDAPAILVGGGSALHHSVVPVAPTMETGRRQWPLVAAAVVMVIFALAVLAGKMPDFSWFRDRGPVTAHAKATMSDDAASAGSLRR